MAKKQKYYAVWQGNPPGLYNSWPKCQAAIKGISGAQYKSFDTLAQAEKALAGAYKDAISVSGKKKTNAISAEQKARIGAPNLYSIAVDAASSGNPGRMEYQGVDTQTGKLLFHQGPYQQGTNNIGEFLALVHGLAYLKKEGSDRAIYSDSRIAIGWVRKKKCGTKLAPHSSNKILFELIARAESWLRSNTYSTSILKWETKAWGEIPADFGRK